MAKALRLLKYPKKPKSGASTLVLENYLRRCKEVDRKNAEKKREHAHREKLQKQISGIGKPGHRSFATHRKRKSPAVGKKRKTSRKTTRRR